MNLHYLNGSHKLPQRPAPQPKHQASQAVAALLPKVRYLQALLAIPLYLVPVPQLIQHLVPQPKPQALQALPARLLKHQAAQAVPLNLHKAQQNQHFPAHLLLRPGLLQAVPVLAQQFQQFPPKVPKAQQKQQFPALARLKRLKLRTAQQIPRNLPKVPPIHQAVPQPKPQAAQRNLPKAPLAQQNPLPQLCQQIQQLQAHLRHRQKEHSIPRKVQTIGYTMLARLIILIQRMILVGMEGVLGSGPGVVYLRMSIFQMVPQLILQK